MGECIFCKIVSGDLPCYKIAETEHLLAFLDIGPISKGHALVIPKQHKENFLDFPSALGDEFIAFTQSVARAIMGATGAGGFNIGLNNDKAAGQVVFHTHFHIIPRWSDDGLSLWPSHEVSREELQELQQEIQKKL